MPKTTFVVPGSIKWASSRLRGYWVAEHMENAQVLGISEASEAQIDPGDIFILIKVKMDEESLLNLKRLGARIFWDICDPVHWFKPDLAAEMASYAEMVVTSNHALELNFKQCLGLNNVITIKDRLKLEHYPKRRIHEAGEPIKFIWYGASQNRASLFGCLTNLGRLYANGIPLFLTIFDDRPQDAWDMEDIPIRHIGWELEQENEVISSHDIVLNPPYPGPWGRVKSNNKELTAWACGLPAVDGFDYEHMLDLVHNHKARQNIADINYSYLKKHYNVAESAREWNALLENLHG